MFMDRYRDRVPVRTIGSGTRYDGKVWFESLCSIRSINGTPTSNVEKSMLNAGDLVTIVFKNRTYSGVVDLTGDVAVREESDGSPTKSPSSAAPQSRDGTREEERQDVGEPPQPLEEKQEPALDQQPRQEVKVETSSRPKTKTLKRPRDSGASPPRVARKKKKFVQKKEGKRMS